MHLVIDGRDYPIVTPATALVLHAVELKQQSRAYFDGGLGTVALDKLQRAITTYERVLGEWKKSGEAGEEPSPPDEIDMWWPVLMFLSRRAAGDKVTFTEAISSPIPDVVADPEDEEPEAVDPTQPAPGSPGTPVVGE